MLRKGDKNKIQCLILFRSAALKGCTAWSTSSGSDLACAPPDDNTEHINEPARDNCQGRAHQEGAREPF